jgi:flagellar basal-body rod modification protein FlgD
MNVSDIASSAASSSGATASTDSTKKSGSSSGLGGLSDVNSFLTLLVKQLQNQDPLSPQDGSQFAAQLAQFSSLDQLVGINSRLTQLLDAASTPPQTTTTTASAKLPTDTVATPTQATKV